MPETKLCQLDDLGQGFHRLILHYGFMQPVDVPTCAETHDRVRRQFKMIETSFFLSRQTLIAAKKPGMPIWRSSVRMDAAI